MSTGPRGSKPAREIFLTSSSLSFPSFSSSCASSSDDDDDAVEINMEASPTSSGEEDQKGTLLKASSGGSEMSCLTHVTMQPAPSPPSKSRPGSPYDPKRIPASVFGKKTKDSNWSDESLFSLRMSNYDAFRKSNLMPEEFLAYSPSLKVKSEDAEEGEAMKKKKTSVEETNNKIHREMSLSPTPSAYSYPSSFAQLYQAPPSTKAQQSIPPPVSEKKNKKRRKKTRKNKKEKKNNNKCCCSICSWLFSGFSKCKYCCCCCCCK
ncbi:hypothetical protein Rs2_29754 [Raphanus sativus]|nr:hypothetical protein Rs2_29754 [Raphanus sativus]